MTPRMLVRNEGTVGDGSKMVIDGVEEVADGPKNKDGDLQDKKDMPRDTCVERPRPG